MPFLLAGIAAHSPRSLAKQESWFAFEPKAVGKLAYQRLGEESRSEAELSGEFIEDNDMHAVTRDRVRIGLFRAACLENE